MTNSSITFINQQWLWPVILVSLLLLLVFVWKEYNSSSKRRVLKIFIAFVAIVSLSMLVLKPAIIKKTKTLNVAIVTPNFKNAQLDSLEKVYKNLKTITYSEGEILFNDSTRPTNVFILGQGIASFDMWQLTGISTTFLSGNAPKGIIQLKYFDRPFIGTTINLKGAYSKASKGQKLYLLSPAGIAIDSMELEESSLQQFNLKGEVNVNGQLVYALEEKDSVGNILLNQPLPISVTNENKLKILILNGFPTFETKYLKNYLAQLGHELIIRSQLTRGRYKYEYFNTSDKTRPSLRKEHLTDFDILIIDVSSVNNLSNAQSNNIINAINDEGLGVFVQPDSNIKNLKTNLNPFKHINDASKTFSLVTDGIEIPKYSFVFQTDIMVEPIHFNNSKVYSAYKLYGNGKVASTVAFNTYELLLNGNTSEYQKFWTDIIDVIGKKQAQLTDWESVSPFAVIDQPFHFKLRSAMDKPIVKLNNSIIPLRQDINVKSVWHGKVYPRNHGWHRLQTEQDSTNTFHYFVTDTSKYKTLRAYNRTLMNARHFSSLSTETSNFTSSEPIDPLWFYIVFLLSMGFLWLEPKI